MYFKLAFENVRKSFKIYRIYFLTMGLAVSIFYSFNSIESQQAILDLSKSKENPIDLLINSIEIISIFVSFILGGLILYANNFLIKKRKKELGIYRTLGMSNLKISQVIVIETVIVGILSLVVGLLIGLVLSQGLSAFASKLFEVDMSKYKFIISSNAIQKTIVYFGIIFLIVMIFNVITISRYKIIDLVNASKKVENIKFKNPIVYVLTFFTSTYLLLTSYKSVINLLPNELTNYIVLKIVGFGILGTFLFFYSLAGVFLYITKKNKKIYFKNLNIFIIKQLNSKINTNFLSISVICLMLFLTIVMLSTGIGFKNASEKILIDSTPFDVSISLYSDDSIKTVEESLNAVNFKFDDTEKYVYFDIYDSGVKLKDIINKKDLINKYILSDEFDFYNIDLIKLSDYNNIRKLKGKDTESLKENEIILTSNNRSILDILNKEFEKNKKINLYNKEYKIKNGDIIEESLKSSPYLNNIATLIVNDSIVQNAETKSSNLNVQFTKNKKKSEKNFRLLLDSFREGKVDYNKAGFLNGDTKQEIYINNKGAVTIVLFIEMYLGIIFLISSMAILAIQQLSEANDSIERYKAIERLGANEKMINKTIFIQILIYFGLPISLAFLHSIIGIKVIYNVMESVYNPDIKYTLISTAIIFLVVYFEFFYCY